MKPIIIALIAVVGLLIIMFVMDRVWKNMSEDCKLDMNSLYYGKRVGVKDKEDNTETK